MRVIKHGNKVYPKQHTCRVCECIFEYDESDLKREIFEVAHISIARERNIYHTVKCPECGSPYRTIVDSKIIR